MHWTVAAPFTSDASERWLVPHVRSRLNHTFDIIPRVGPREDWHARTSPRTGREEWLRLFQQGGRAFARSRGGVITVFPQLAAIVGALKRGTHRRRMPVLSWFFNTTLGDAARDVAARWSLAVVDRFVTHTTVEGDVYARALRMDRRRFQFVHLQYGGLRVQEPVDEERPFVFATGSGFRDYATFFDAMARLDLKAYVLASPHALENTTPPPNVEILDSLPKEEILRRVCRAAVNVVPMNTSGYTAGIVTIVEAFSHGRALVATRRPGLEDYLFHDQNCLLAPPGDGAALAAAIDAMASDQALRARLDRGALDFADAYCTDAAVGASLGRILDELEEERPAGVW